MDTVTTGSLTDFRNSGVGTSAADLFKAYTKEETTEEKKEEDSLELNPSLEKTATQLFEEKTAGKKEESETKTEEELAAEAAAASLEAKAKTGRPTEKLSEQTKNDIISLIEEGKLEGFDDGKYETKQDLQDLLEANKEKWKEDSYTQVKSEFINSLNPGMQFIAKYAEHVSHPSELLPYLTAVDNHAYVQDLDVEDASDQEQIIREISSIKGLPDKEIEADIADLKERNKLAERAKLLKPQLDNYTKQQIISLQQQQAAEIERERAYWQNREKELKTAILDAPQLDGLKLKAEHKQLAFTALSQRGQTGDLLIYSIIDNLVKNNDLDTLSQIAILGLDKKAYKAYIASQQKTEDAQATMRMLKSREKPKNSLSPDDESTLSNTGGLKRPLNNGLGSLPRR